MASVKSQIYQKKRSADDGCPSYKRQKSKEINFFERQDSGVRTNLANTLAGLGVESPGTGENSKEEEFTRCQEKSHMGCISQITEQNRSGIEPTTGSHENDVNGFDEADGIAIDREKTIISESDRTDFVDTFTKESQGEDQSCVILDVAQKVKQGIDTVQDLSDDVLHKFEEGIVKVFNREQSVEELPSNNVNLRHPYGYAEPLSFGVHIIQCDRGMQIKRLLEDGFAKSAKLMEDDVITQINGSDVRSASLSEVLSQFGEIDTTETFTLRILRWERQEGNNKPNIYEFDLTLQIKVDEDHETVTFEVTLTATRYKYDRTASSKVIRQLSLSISEKSKYLRIEKERLAMSDSVDQFSCFDIDLYKPSYPTRVCVVRNTTCGKAIDSKAPGFLRTAQRDPPDRLIDDNSKFFKWHCFRNDDEAFESIAKPGCFLHLKSDGTFELMKSTLESLPDGAKFKVLNK